MRGTNEDNNRQVTKSWNVRASLILGAIAILALVIFHRDIVEGLSTSSTIHEAAKRGRQAEVERYLERGVAVNARNESGETPLHLAAAEGHNELVRYLIAKGADVNPVDQNGDTPLHVAAHHGHRDVVEWLLAKGADVNAKNGWKVTPLYLAGSEGHSIVVNLLISEGADLNTKYRWGPLDVMSFWLHCYNPQCSNEYSMAVREESAKAMLDLGTTAFDPMVPRSGLTCPKCKEKGLAFPMLCCPKCKEYYAQDISAVQVINGRSSTKPVCPVCKTDYADYVRKHSNELK